MGQTNQPNEWITEEALATALKVERGLLKAKRPYLGPGEVQIAKNGAVEWAAPAAQRVAVELGVPFLLEEKTPAGQAEAPPDDTETLTVIAQAVNRNIVNARRATGEVVPVRVVDNRKYVPRLGNGKPMTLTAKKNPAGNWWLLVGREPRWVGVW